MFGEFSTNSYAGNSSSYSSGDYSRMQVEYKSLSLNGRWNMLNKKFMPYIDGGLGVSAGTHYWNTTDDSPVLGVIGQLGIGAKLYFGKFGIFADTKSCLVFNTKRINGEQKTAPAYAVNLLQQNFRFGICLGF